jgi:hypothetical protein
MKKLLKKSHKVIRTVRYFDGEKVEWIQMESSCTCPRETDHIETNGKTIQTNY